MAKYNKYMTVAVNEAAAFHEITGAQVSGWNPHANDVIICTPYNYDPNNNLDEDVDQSNVKLWSVYDATLNTNQGGYKIYVSDSTWTGTFYYVIKTA